MICYIKNNYESDEIIVIRAEDVRTMNFNGEMLVQLIRIYDYYDESFWVNADGVVHARSLTCKITSPLEKGLYALRCIKEKESSTIIMGNDFSENVDSLMNLGVFSVGIEGKREQYLSVVEYIQGHREEQLSAIKTKNQPKGEDIFDVYVFLKNIKVKTNLYYGGIELMPFSEFVCLSEISIINEKMNEIGIQLNFDKHMKSEVRPTAIACVRNIQSGNGIEAEKLAINKAEILNYLYSFLTRGNGEIIAAVSLNKTNATSHIQISDAHYTGDLLLLGDQGFYIRHLYEGLCADNERALMYLKLFNEAMRENKRMPRFLKLWMTLVTIAEGKGYVGKEKRDWNGNIKGIIKLNDKNLVFELFRECFAKEDPNQNRFTVDYINSAEDFMRVCYARRCCYAHHGTCIIGNSAVCKNDEDHILCRMNSRADYDYELFDDHILFRLESVVNEIISRELRLSIGETKKNKLLLEAYLFDLCTGD